METEILHYSFHPIKLTNLKNNIKQVFKNILETA